MCRYLRWSWAQFRRLWNIRCARARHHRVASSLPVALCSQQCGSPHRVWFLINISAFFMRDVFLRVRFTLHFTLSILWEHSTNGSKAFSTKVFETLCLQIVLSPFFRYEKLCIHSYRFICSQDVPLLMPHCSRRWTFESWTENRSDFQVLRCVRCVW